MPPIRHGPLSGFYFPDYDRGSVVNLLASLIRSRGGRSPHPELEDLPAAELARVRRIVFLIVDGLGKEQLDRFVGSGGGKAFLAARPHRVISTVFPATTAAAITTFNTGASPTEHGVLGWHLHLADLGLVATILPATTRTGTPLADAGFSLRDYLEIPSYIESASCRTRLISYGTIPQSRYSQALTRWDDRASATTLRGLERQILAFARSRGAGLAQAYWPGYDSYCHEVGCDHPRTLRHLREIDLMLGRLVEALEGTDAGLVVTADHGLMDAKRGGHVELRSIRGLYDCLALLPSGDARGVHCFVRPRKVDEFLAIVEERLSDSCACIPGTDLLELGTFGPGKPHRALASRVGDYVLLARDGHALQSTPTGFETHFKAGNHGGMSRSEVLVPLWAESGDASLFPCETPSEGGA